MKIQETAIVDKIWFKIYLKKDIFFLFKYDNDWITFIGGNMISLYRDIMISYGGEASGAEDRSKSRPW